MCLPPLPLRGNVPWCGPPGRSREGVGVRAGQTANRKLRDIADEVVLTGALPPELPARGS
jgi:hypothetical protein